MFDVSNKTLRAARAYKLAAEAYWSLAMLEEGDASLKATYVSASKQNWLLSAKKYCLIARSNEEGSVNE